MRLFKVKRADAFDPGLAYRTLKKIGVRGQMTIARVEDLMHDYVWPVKPSRMNSGRQIYDDKRAQELQRVFGDFGSIARNGIYIGLSKDELRQLFRALDSVTRGKVTCSFTLGLDVVEVK